MAGVATSVGTSRSARFRRAMEGLFIRSETGASIPMRFSQSQEILWSHIAPKLDRHEKVWIIVLKARQIYSSTFFCALTFVRTLEKAGTHSIVLAHDLFTSHELFERVKTFNDHLPLPKLRAPRMNELTFPFPDGTSRYRVISAGSVAKGRGTTQSAMLMSEIPSWPHPEIAAGLFQAMPDLPDTMLIEESTARGVSGPGKLFWEEWNRATRGESDLTPIFIPWFTMRKYRRTPAVPRDDWDKEEQMLHETYDVDGEQLSWRRYTIKTKVQNSLDMFHQEYPSSPAEAFIASGMPAFDRLALMEQQKNVTAPLWRGDFVEGKLIPNDRGVVRIWEHPTAAGQYAVGADTAMGMDGGNYTAAEVIDMTSLKQVASVHGIIQPYEFAVLLNSLGRYYNRAVLCIEVYPQGHTVQDHLIRTFFYPNLHRWRGKPDRVRLTPARLYGWECLDPDAKVLTRDLRWVPARHVKVGDQLLGCEEQPLRGRGRVNRLRTQTVTKRAIFTAPVVDVVLENGHRTRVSSTHPFWSCRPPATHWNWIAAADLHAGDTVKSLSVWEAQRSYDAGRLSAFLDGEGHLSKSTKSYGIHLLVSQVEGPLAAEIRDLWMNFGFKTTFKAIRHRQRPQEQPLTVSGVIRLPDVLRALGSLRPSRLLGKFTNLDLGHLSIKSFASVPVVSVVPAGEGPVVGLTTDPDHTLIADGIVGHNTNVWSRPMLIGSGQRAINHGLLTIREDGLLEELMHFSKNDADKFEAEVGYDDRVIALLLALRSREENFIERRAPIEVTEPPMPTSIRIAETRDATMDARKRLSKLIREKADKAVKHWMAFAFAAAVLVGSGPAWAQSPTVPVQNSNSKNQEATAAANTAVVITVAGVTGLRVHLAAITARCSAGSASLTVQDGATTIWSSDAAFVGTSTTTVTWTPKPLATAYGASMTVTLGTCGVGNTGVLDLQAEQF